MVTHSKGKYNFYLKYCQRSWPQALACFSWFYIGASACFFPPFLFPVSHKFDGTFGVLSGIQPNR